MTEADLIAKQALRIAELEEYKRGTQENLNKIIGNLVCIGGPLNDNFHGYTRPQLDIFYRIEGLAKEFIERCDCDA